MTTPREVRWAGDSGLLIAVTDNESPQALAAWLTCEHGHELVEIVPGVATVLAVGPQSVLSHVAVAVPSRSPLGNRTDASRGRGL